MSTTLSLEASKKVFEIVGEYETEKVWLKAPDGKWGCDEPIELSVISHDMIEDGYDFTPTPNFAELIRVLVRFNGKLDSFVDVATCAQCGKAQSALEMCEHGPDWEEMIARIHYIANLYIESPTEPEGMAAVENYLMKLL